MKQIGSIIALLALVLGGILFVTHRGVKPLPQRSFVVCVMAVDASHRIGQGVSIRDAVQLDDTEPLHQRSHGLWCTVPHILRSAYGDEAIGYRVGLSVIDAGIISATLRTAALNGSPGETIVENAFVHDSVTHTFRIGLDAPPQVAMPVVTPGFVTDPQRQLLSEE